MDPFGRVVSENDTPSVLIVDDAMSNLELVEEVFVRAGFRVYSALDAYSALDIFRAEKIDIAVLDVMMPLVDGYQLCRELKELSERQFFPVILLTALADTRSRITGIECGADDFISKPFDRTELVTKARALLKIRALHDELEHTENVILALAATMEARDPYTHGHSTRVGEISRAFVSFMGLAKKDQDQIRKAGILHDVGKIGLSSTLLCKKGCLTHEEFDAIKRHPVIGEEICRPLLSMQGILPSIRSHHERWDGYGFPDGLKGDEIPLPARILAIADCFDAMVSDRPYREARSFDQVIGVFRHERSSGQWDPALVDLFLEMMHTMEPESIVHV